MNENAIKANQELGKQGEEMAVRFLSDLGFNILERNWRTGHLEIDIIAETAKEFVFIEVKTRVSDYLADPFAAVNRKKQRLLVRAADAYMQQSSMDKPFRFDIISVVINQFEQKIEHIEDAFYPLP